MQTTFGLFLLRFWLIFLFLTLEIGTASAEITYSGKITDNPSGWISSTNAYIGYFGTGTVTVNGGDDIISKSGRIGYSGNGEVTIDGLDSSWRMTSNLYAGYMGNGVAGKINITERVPKNWTGV